MVRVYNPITDLNGVCDPQRVYNYINTKLSSTSVSSFALTLLDDLDASAMRTTLGLGTLATQSGTFSGTHSGTSNGTNTGDQTSIVGISGTKAQFDTAVTDGNFLYVGDITQYTDELAQDAIGTILVDSSEIDFTYSDVTPSITASLVAGSIDETKLDASVNASLDLADSSAQNTFRTIAVSGQSDIVADSATDTLTVVAGTNITITTDAATDSLTINSSGGGGNSFSTIAISGQSDVVADSASDILTLVAGTNITLTTDAGTDTITIAASGGGGGGLTQPQIMAIQSLRF